MRPLCCSAAPVPLQPWAPTGSWIIAVLACAAVIWITLVGRNARRARHGFAPRPVWAESFVAGLACLVILGSAAVVNAYNWAPGHPEDLL
jgi:D-xylose transport system permease protein